MRLGKSIYQSATALSLAEFDEGFRSSMVPAAVPSGTSLSESASCEFHLSKINGARRRHLGHPHDSEVPNSRTPIEGRAQAMQYALALCHSEQWEDAINVLESLTTSDPANVSVTSALSVAWNNLGNRRRSEARFAEAVDAFQKAMDVAPHVPEIQRNFALALIEIGDLDAAKARIEEALRLRPNWPEAIETFSIVLGSQSKHAEAIDLLQHVTEHRPGLTSAWRNLGVLCGIEDRVEEAESAFMRLNQLEPRSPQHQLMASLLCPEVVCQRAEYEERLARIESAIDCCFSASPRRVDLNELTSFVGNPSVNWQYFHGSLRFMKERLAEWARSLTDSPAVSEQLHPGRMGFVVTTGHERAFATSMMPILQRLPVERERKLVFCSRYSKRILEGYNISHEVLFAELGSSLAHSIESIRQSSCCLLYHWEVGTDPLNYILPFFRLAPCQVTSWGHQVTSGIKEIDYYLSSQLLEPEHAQKNYTEQLVMLDSLMLFRPHLSRQLDKSLRDQLAQPSERVYFCSHRAGKIHPDMDSVFTGIQKDDSKAVIVLLADKEKSSAAILLSRLRAAGVDIQRVRLVGLLEDRAYRGLLASADALLDGPHFSGANSTYDALELGRPIVGWESGFQKGRYTAACLRRLDVEQLIATDAESMINKAVALARNDKFRRDAEQRIYRNAAQLFEDEQCVKEHARVLLELTRRQSGEATR